MLLECLIPVYTHIELNQQWVIESFEIQQDARMMTSMNLPKHHSQQNRKPGLCSDCFIGFPSPSLHLTFSCLQMIFATKYFWESPGGVFPSALSLGQWGVVLPLGASRQWVSTPMEMWGACRVPKVLAIQVTRWEGDRSPRGFAPGRLPKQRCSSHMYLHQCSRRSSLQATHTSFYSVS